MDADRDDSISSDPSPSPVLLTGATGFVGGHLGPALEEEGYSVRWGTRDVEGAREAHPGRDWVRFDVDDAESVEAALAGCRSACYLVHRMAGEGDFAAQEEAAARRFRDAAERAGVGRIVYLGGVCPPGTRSRHLLSRRRTGEILRAGSVETAELRAAMIVGAGSESFRICRDLSLRLPLMVLPRWLKSRSQPIAIEDVVLALLLSLDTGRVPPGVHDLPGPEVLSGREILLRIARLRGTRPLMLDVPLLSPRLSSYWIQWVTRGDRRIARELVEGLRDDLLMEDPGFWTRCPEHERVPFDEAARRALADGRGPSLPGSLLESIVRIASWPATPPPETRDRDPESAGS